MREHVRDGWENHFKAIDLPSIPTLFTLSRCILTVEEIQEDFVFVRNPWPEWTKSQQCEVWEAWQEASHLLPVVKLAILILLPR